MLVSGSAADLGLLLGAALVGAVVAAFVVYVVQERKRAAVREALEDSRRALAVEQQRLGDLTRRFGEVSEALATEGRLRTDAEKAGTQLEAKLGVTRERLEGVTTSEQIARDALACADAERRALGEQVTRVQAFSAALEKERDGLQAQLVEQKTWVAEQTTLLGERVLATAAQLMEERGKAFTETNKKEVDAVVAPFKERLAEFRQRVDEIYAADTRERSSLAQQIVQLTDLNKLVSVEAGRLVNALTITSKSAGTWGETILARILEDSGLREGHEYALQVSIKGRSGETLQPDAVLTLPESRQLVVDSKVSNKAWTEYCAASDDEARQTHLAAHLLSLRAHIKNLSGKDYASSPDLRTVDFVILFVPIEAALLAALAADPHLYSEAYRARIILVTPSTLMAVVKLSEGLWTLQKRKESADQIAEAGRKLYEKLANFAQTFVDVGSAIEDSQRAYEKARGQLATGKGNAIGLAEKLKELGVTPAAGKGMPRGLLEKESDEGAAMAPSNESMEQTVVTGSEVIGSKHADA